MKERFRMAWCSLEVKLVWSMDSSLTVVPPDVVIRQTSADASSLGVKCPVLMTSRVQFWLVRAATYWLRNFVVEGYFRVALVR